MANSPQLNVKASLNSYKISVKEWDKKTNEIRIISKSNRYGGIYSHKDIAFNLKCRLAQNLIVIDRRIRKVKNRRTKTNKIG